LLTLIQQRIALAVVLSALTAGCVYAPVPVAENFPYATQRKVRAAGHWDVVADDLIQETFRQAPAVLADKVALHVVLPDNPSTFDRTLRELLITRLVQQGYVVTAQPGRAALHLNAQVQLVRHHSSRPSYIPGAFTVLTAGVLAAHYAAVHAHPDFVKALALGAAAVADVEAGRSTGGPTHTELVLTASLAQGERYLARSTRVYYVEDHDAPLFQAPARPVPTRTFMVVAQ